MNNEIISRALNRDIDAFGSLVEIHQDRWIRLAMSLLGRKEDALDAYQEGLINLYRSITSFRQEASFATWASRIMINTCLRYRKNLSKRRQRELVQTDVPESNSVPDCKLTDKDVLDKERTKILRMAIQKLPQRQQMAVILKYDGRMTIQEVSETMGCGLGTVKRYLYRAMGKLKDDLRSYFK